MIKAKLVLKSQILICFGLAQAANICDIRGADQLKINKPCPLHPHKTVSSYVNVDGRPGHGHYEDGDKVFWQDIINLVSLRGTKNKSLF